jgi:KDO2-lipid IV(A) lauroyltransferase
MNAFLIAWRASRVLPVSVIRGAVALISWWGWVTRSRPVKRLEGNLHTLTGLEGRELRALSRKSMASTARYYAETLEFARMKPAAVDARVRMDGYAPTGEAMAKDGRVVIALGHSGNWDLVGAYTCRNVARVTAVAEVLKPKEVFDQFVAVREKWGLQIVGYESSSTFRTMVGIGKREGGILALVADRDLSGSGIEVDFGGQPARVAPGPAALALAVGCALQPLFVRYERLHGARRRAAKSRWGVVMEFGPFVEAPTTGTSAEKVDAMTKQWAAWLGEEIRKHPQDWHMLQRFGWVD